MSARGPWAVQVRGAAGASAATARLLDDALLLEHALGVTVVELATLDGVTHEGATVAFHPHGQAALAVESAEAAALARAVIDAATGVPEVAASLRAMGSPRARPGSDHDAWFGALLAARRAAHEATTPAARLAAFDAAALRAAMLACLDGFATARAPESAPDARALAEEFRERTAPYAVALERLAVVRGTVDAASDAVRLARWQEWVGALRAVFSAADGAWEAMLPALADPRGRSGSFWRRVLRRGSAT